MVWKIFFELLSLALLTVSSINALRHYLLVIEVPALAEVAFVCHKFLFVFSFISVIFEGICVMFTRASNEERIRMAVRNAERVYILREQRPPFEAAVSCVLSTSFVQCGNNFSEDSSKLDFFIFCCSSLVFHFLNLILFTRLYYFCHLTTPIW